MPSVGKRKQIINLPAEYSEAVTFGNVLFPYLFEFENGLRLAVHKYLCVCYGADWWSNSLRMRKKDIFEYSENQKRQQDLMPWIGASARVQILPIHLITLGQLEEIVRVYRSDCIPQLFPTMEFFLGHMEVIKRVRNLYSHMFPCLTKDDCQLAKREILTLSTHINTKI